MKANFTNILTNVKGLDVNVINDSREQMKSGNKARFDASLKLAKQAIVFKEFFGTKEGKDLLAKSKGVTLEELIKETFGVNKSWFYKLCRVAKLKQTVITNYRKEARNAEKRGEVFTLSVADLLKSEGSSKKKAKKDKPETILSFFAKGDGDSPIKVSIDEKGQVTTKSSKKDILSALNILTEALKNAK